ncbi:MAG: enoyl-CoA hydratase-related protein [Chloroflexota bacterium]
MNYQTLLTELNDGVLEVTLNRPDKYNALTHEVSREMMALCFKAATDADVRSILLTGAGKGFCAGQDLSEVSDRGESYSLRVHLNNSYNPMVSAMRRLEKPIIVAVNGPCAGAGFGLALGGDIRYASEKAVFLTAFIGIGLAPDSGVSYWLPRLIGPARAAEMLFTNERVSAARAAEIGLINRAIPHDELMGESRKLAQKLAAGPPIGLGLTKRALNHSLGVTLDDHIDYEGQLQDIAGHSADYKEGVAAFKEKRQPNFKGK